MSEQLIAQNKVVSIHYTLRNEEGKVIDSSRGGGPMPYLHGHGNIIPGLEKQLEGKKVGDKLTAVVPPAEAHGERTGEPHAVPRREFPKDMVLEEHRPFRTQNSAGEEVVLWVHAIKGSRVYIHTDHPLAGQTLTFDVDVLHIRDADAEEIDHGHVHGPGGHH